MTNCTKELASLWQPEATYGLLVSMRSCQLAKDGECDLQLTLFASDVVSLVASATQGEMMQVYLCQATGHLIDTTVEPFVRRPW